MVTGYRVPLTLGYAAGGHGGSCVFNRITYVGGLFTDSAWAIAARVAKNLQRSYLRSRCRSLETRPWPVSVLLVLLGFACDFRRATVSSPYLSSVAGVVLPACVSECLHPSGSSADSSLHPSSYSRFERACLVCCGVFPPPTFRSYNRMPGMTRVAGKESLSISKMFNDFKHLR